MIIIEKKSITKPSKVDKWLTEDGLATIKAWKRKGLTNEQIADNIGIGKSTLYRWKSENRELSEAFEISQDEANMIAENALYKLAIGGIKVTEEIQEMDIDGSSGNAKNKHVKRIIKELPPNMAALAFYLKNRGKWQDNPEATAFDNSIKVTIDWEK